MAPPASEKEAEMTAIAPNTTAPANKDRSDIEAAMKAVDKGEVKVTKVSRSAPPKAKKATSKKAPVKKERPSDERVIHLVVADNPKRGASAHRYGLYKDGMSVEAYVQAGGKRADIAWDLERGFIAVGADLASAKASVKETKTKAA